MKLNLRAKTIGIILLTSIVAILMAGVMFNIQTERAFNTFLNGQLQFLEDNRPRMMPGMPDFRALRGEASHLLLERQFARELWRAVVGASVLASGVAFVVGFFFSDRITRPLRELKRHVNRMKQHHYDEPVVVYGDDEVAEIGADFESLRQELWRVEELRKDAVSDLAHEIATPLQSLLGIVEGIEDGMYQAKDKAEDMKNAIERIQTMTEDLRRFSHARSKARSCKKERIDLSSFVPHELGSLSAEAKTKGITLATDIPAGLELETDRSMLSHILLNLVKNAVQYTDEGRVEVRISEVTTRAGQKKAIRFMVEDTGSGIAPTDLPYIFERFYRGDRSRNRKTGGTGLGLAIVKEYVDQLGWTIEVASEPGKGSTFTLLCP
ncbi:hypothetical protein AUK40_03105 [Candidatus Wirthbacteria bacterium CG2_30_54_11]|uniref:histidine kinase n=1 Tax=Candidatus Wirthbacteria bacterium CG2_30_54_11 TaxID=1817892 RepID=A0A1J5ISU9_9BACT|nr:MAG: hypothetical protein AUK40_03105 [Candidatus Wirthbacteria bacterium CG2_30_54_11]